MTVVFKIFIFFQAITEIIFTKSFVKKMNQNFQPIFFLNPKGTSWGLKGPVAYISLHCVSLKNRYLLKRYVFLKNIVLHNIMCETNWIVITTKFYR